jgi:LmbE family N-acetylglucosaminyl deacetylase
MSRAETAVVRQAEQRAAAACVGVRDIVFRDHPDGAVVASLALRRDITRVIRRTRPDRVLTSSPEINWQQLPTAHPDHRAVGEATLAAVFPDARNPQAHPKLLAEEGLEPWSVRELWLADSPAWLRNQVVDVTAAFDKRLAALRAHTSQVGGIADLEGFVRGYLGENGRRHGLTDGQLAEEFQVVDIR